MIGIKQALNRKKIINAVKVTKTRPKTLFSRKRYKIQGNGKIKSRKKTITKEVKSLKE